MAKGFAPEAIKFLHDSATASFAQVWDQKTKNRVAITGDCYCFFVLWILTIAASDSSEEKIVSHITILSY